MPPGSTESRPTVATAPSIPLRDLPRLQHELGRRDERVLAPVHRRRAGVARRAGEAAAAAHVADDRGHDAERRLGAEERRALLDVQLDVGVGTDAGRHARPAAGAAPFLVAEDDDAEPRQAERLDRLEPRDDAERAVEAAGAGDRVEVRARPHLPAAARDPPDQVAGGVDLHLEPGLAEPARRQLVRRVLLRRVADPVAECGQLVEALEDPHSWTVLSRRSEPRLLRLPHRAKHQPAGEREQRPRARTRGSTSPR